jgi:lipid II:glycine glycyltransferase (peptidoglycan interpeptide bridge formation enzyme)
MAYVPWGPELSGDWGSGFHFSAAVELVHALRPHLRGAAFIRFDPPFGIGIRDQGLGTRDFCSDDNNTSEFYPDISDHDPQSLIPSPQSHFVKAAADIQPPDTVLLDLTQSEEDILAAMKSKWRYNIGLAEKHGVVVTESGEQGMNDFYRLLSETAARDGIAIHNIEYYRALFTECAEGGESAPPLQLRLYTAAHEGDVLAAIVVLFRGKEATYLYGASSNIKRNLMAPYALQWQAMRDAKAFGCTEYDLFGIPPDENPDHPMAGLYRFKTGFGGRIIHRPGSWDYPCKPALYTLFRCAESLRKKARDSRKRR